MRALLVCAPRRRISGPARASTTPMSSKSSKDRMKDSGLAPGGDREPPAPSPLPLQPSKIAAGPRIDKKELIFGADRRFRDKAHLQYVASQPCLICGRQ